MGWSTTAVGFIFFVCCYCEDSPCIEHLNGVGGVEIFSNQVNIDAVDYVCGFTDFNGSPQFHVYAMCVEGFCGTVYLKVNGMYYLEGQLHLMNEYFGYTGAIFNGPMSIYGSLSLYYETSITDANCEIMVGSTHVAISGSLRMFGAGKFYVASGPSTVVLGSVAMIDSNFTVLPMPGISNFDIVLYYDFLLTSCNISLQMGPAFWNYTGSRIHCFDSDLLLQTTHYGTYKRGDWLAANILLQSHSRMALLQSDQVCLHFFLLELRQSSFKAETDTVWFADFSNMYLYDSSVHISQSGWMAMDNATIVGRSIAIELNDYARFYLNDSSFDVTNLDVHLGQSAQLIVRSTRLVTTGQNRLRITLDKGSSLLVNTRETSEFLSCELLADIYVPEDAVFTEKDLMQALTCTATPVHVLGKAHRPAIVSGPRTTTRNGSRPRKDRISFGVGFPYDVDKVFICPSQNHSCWF